MSKTMIYHYNLYSRGMHIYFRKIILLIIYAQFIENSPVARWPTTSDVTLLGVHRK